MSAEVATTSKRSRAAEAPPPAPLAEVVELEQEHDEDEGDAGATQEAEPEAPPKAAERTFSRKGTDRAMTPERRDLTRKQDQTLTDWLTALQGSGPIQVRIQRLKPQMFNGKQVKGHLETVDELISEDEIRDRYGGGEIQLRVMEKNKSGTWVFMTSTTIDVAGDPRTDNLPKANPHAGDGSASPARDVRADSDPLVGRMVGFLEDQVKEAKAAATRGGSAGLEQMMLILKPFELQLVQLQQTLAAKDKQIAEFMNKPTNPFQDQMMGKLIDQDTARVNAVRDQLLSEIRTIKENAREDEKRAQDRFDRDKQMMQMVHERELANLRASNELVLGTLRSSYEAQINSLKSVADNQKENLNAEVRRYERDLNETRIEVKELRAKKELSPLEIAKISETYSEAFGGGKDDSEKGTIEKIAEAALGSEKLFEFAGRWFGPKGAAQPGQPQPGAPQQPQQRQLPRFKKDKRTGQVYALAPDGQYHPIRRRRAPDGTETDEVEEGVELDPADIEKATFLLEQAFKNGMKPEVVATSARTQVSPEVMQMIQDHGVDGFLKKVAKLSAASPLATLEGTNWCRKLGKSLLGE